MYIIIAMRNIDKLNNSHRRIVNEITGKTVSIQFVYKSISDEQVGDLLEGYSVGWFENSRKGLVEYKLKLK